jgi:hypothetical protein
VENAGDNSQRATRRGSSPIEARYTRIVGKWHVRAVSSVLVVLLAGGPAVARLCDGLCSGGSQASVQPVSSHGHHHSAAGESIPHAAAGAAQGADHTHHQSETATPATSAEPHSIGHVWPGRACCCTPGQLRASVTASRTVAGLLPAPQAADLPPGVVSASLDRRPRGPTDGPSPGALPSARTPLVLRI